MKIQEIIDMWKNDSVVDDLNLDLESVKISKLHSKYVGILSEERTLLRNLQLARRNLFRKLREYYLGTATQEDLQDLGREPYLQRILKNEVLAYIESDELLVKHDNKIGIQQEKIDVLLEIMKSINGRNFNVKNMIDWKRLMVGN